MNPIELSLEKIYASEEARKHFPDHQGKLPTIEERTTFWNKNIIDWKNTTLKFKKGTDKRSKVVSFLISQLSYFDFAQTGDSIAFRNGDTMLFVKLTFPDMFD